VELRAIAGPAFYGQRATAGRETAAAVDEARLIAADTEPGNWMGEDKKSEAAAAPAQ
jgi:hypothetical protein